MSDILVIQAIIEYNLNNPKIIIPNSNDSWSIRQRIVVLYNFINNRDKDLYYC